MCEVDAGFACQKWVYKNEHTNSAFTATRRVDSILVAGHKEGKKFSHALFIGTVPWLQFWEFGIGAWMPNDHAPLHFYSIDAQAPTKGALFSATTQGTESVAVGSRSERLQRVSVTIKGLPPMLFKAQLWFSSGDRVLVKSQMPQGPLMPLTTIELKR